MLTGWVAIYCLFRNDGLPPLAQVIEELTGERQEGRWREMSMEEMKAKVDTWARSLGAVDLRQEAASAS